MKIRDSYLYPYPVLSSFSEDYINSIFDVNYTIREKGFKTQILVANFILDDKVIEELILEDKASMILHVECPRTTLRKAYRLEKHQRNIEIIIDDKIMMQRLDVTGIVVLNQDMNTYKNNNINPLFFGENYEIKNLDKGNIIAVSLTQEVDLPYNEDDFENVSSVIKVGLSKDDLMIVEMDGDIIIIKLPEEQYNQYYRLSDTEYSNIVMTSTILPSLIYILDRMSSKENPIDTELIWYKVIEGKLKIKEIMVDDINETYSSIELAQMILEDPLERALGDLEIKAEGE